MKLVLFTLVAARVCLAKDYFFDGSQSSNGNGSPRTPFNTLDAIEGLQIAPGDNILLKRGSSFVGPLVLSQSGADGSPITVGAYGDERAPKPELGAGDQLNAVLLKGTSNVVVQDLSITNPGDNTTPRRGVYVYALDSGEVKNIVLQNLYIHDVRGWLPSTTTMGIGTGKYANASGGIVFEATGNNTATFFTGVTVQDNEIRSVDRQGFYTWTNWCRREALAAFWYSLCFQPWAASTGLVVQRNRLYDIGGDGIVVHGHENAHVHNNVVVGFNRRSGANSAGIWTANSDGSLFQYNTVSGGYSIKDGMSYDVDHSSSGTVFEYNVSHDNEGGFFLLCPYDKPTSNFTIRYNLSVNDRTRIIEICDGQLVGGKIYKNTIQIGDGISPVIVTENTNASLDVLFADNIVRKEGAGAATWQLNNAAFIVSDNIFQGSIDAFSAGTNTTTSPAGLAAPALRDPKAYLLLSGSPALDSAIEVSGDAQRDFFSLPTSIYKNLGFYAGAGTKIPTWISHFDDLTTTGWTSEGAVSIIADPAGDLGNSTQLSAKAVFSRSITTASPFRFNSRIWLDSSVSSGLPSIQLGDSKKGANIAISSQLPFRVGEWQILEITVSDIGITATVDGLPLAVKTSGGSSSVVKFSAGNSVLIVDDIFVTPL